jgi:membrane associated rhomboid family serine protease
MSVMKRWLTAYIAASVLIGLYLVLNTTDPGLRSYSAGLFVGALWAAQLFAVAFLVALGWRLFQRRRAR